MATKFKLLKEAATKRGDHIGLLLPANWIELKGRFSADELLIIANASKANWKKVQSKNSKKNGG